MSFQELLKKIELNEAVVGIFGLGYVGLPLAVEMARAGLKTIGFEKSQLKIDSVNTGKNYIRDVNDNELASIVKSGRLEATNNFGKVAKCDVIIICVPTPLDKFKKPDMTYIETACQQIAQNMKPGAFIVLESTTYPTTTENFVKPIIEKNSGYKEGVDFWLCFSAERVDPGNAIYKTKNTPKVVGALGEEAKIIAIKLYEKCISNLCVVSSPKVAEMTKILENTYRLVNISLINELALLCGKMDIDIWEVIEAAKTKPYGFEAFYPGPGIGGHCIPLDPFYLEHIAKNYQFDLTMINTAGQIDNLMPHRMAVKVASSLNSQKKPVNGSKILILGAAYKANIDDYRESPAIKLAERLSKKGGQIYICDPYFDEIILENGETIVTVPFSENALKDADCVVITAAHSHFNFDDVFNFSNLIVDLRNAIKRRDPKVFRL